MKPITLFRSTIAVTFTFLIFSGLFTYLAVFQISKLTSINLILLLAASLVPIIAEEKRREALALPKPLLAWCFAYLFISLAGYLLSSQSAVASHEVLDRLIFIGFLLLSCAIYNDPRTIFMVRFTIAITTILAIFLNFYEFLNPFSFVPIDSPFSNVGRSAGLYINANQCGFALILGMLLSIELIPDRFRAPFVFAVGLGILPTFSREAIISWTLIVISLSFTKVIKARYIAATASIALVTYVVLSDYIKSMLSLVESVVSVNQNIYGRLIWFNSLSISDESSLERLSVAQQAWDMFWQSPVWGHGVASTVEWNANVSTHNMYLYFMADHGLIGALILPALVFVVVKDARGTVLQVGKCFALFVLVAGLFSHNVIGEYYFIVAFSTMCIMSHRSNTRDSLKSDPDAISEEIVKDRENLSPDWLQSGQFSRQ